MKNPSNYNFDNLELFLKHYPEFLNNFRVINVVGTNGKGTTSYLLQTILQKNFKKVGWFNSPSFLIQNERVQINNHLIPNEAIEKLNKKWMAIWEKYNLKFYQIWFLYSLSWFNQNKVNIAVYEAGIGGVKDSTALVNNQLATILTSVSMDHVDVLGPTINDILLNKILINHNPNPIFVSYDNKSFFKLIQKHSTNAFLCKKINLKFLESYSLVHKMNSNTVVNVANYFNWNYDNDDLKQTLIGRWTKFKKWPNFIIDGAHNIDAVKKLIKEIKMQKLKDFELLVSFAKNKNGKEILNYLIKNKISFKITKFQTKDKPPIKSMEFDNTKYYDQYVENWKDYLIKSKNKNIFIFGSLYFISLVYLFLTSY